MSHARRDLMILAGLPVLVIGLWIVSAPFLRARTGELGTVAIVDFVATALATIVWFVTLEAFRRAVNPDYARQKLRSELEETVTTALSKVYRGRCSHLQENEWEGSEGEFKSSPPPSVAKFIGECSDVLMSHQLDSWQVEGLVGRILDKLPRTQWRETSTSSETKRVSDVEWLNTELITVTRTAVVDGPDLEKVSREAILRTMDERA